VQGGADGQRARTGGARPGQSRAGWLGRAQPRQAGPGWAGQGARAAGRGEMGLTRMAGRGTAKAGGVSGR
jgi:hypothetical protein